MVWEGRVGEGSDVSPEHKVLWASAADIRRSLAPGTRSGCSANKTTLYVLCDTNGGFLLQRIHRSIILYATEGRRGVTEIKEILAQSSRATTRFSRIAVLLSADKHERAKNRKFSILMFRCPCRIFVWPFNYIYTCWPLYCRLHIMKYGVIALNKLLLKNILHVYINHCLLSTLKLSTRTISINFWYTVCLYN